jgi:hypothetical protein
VNVVFDRLCWRVACLFGRRAQLVCISYQVRRLARDLKAFRRRQLMEIEA